ncbi:MULTISPECIES: hypothetical protein [unclassified Streptomyces]|uniref:hypothetical protein n=1 Tax=unclassified Streptomyces TaxID=2593676 RepID=UPI0005EC9407|nr:MULTISPECIES: hypothetical protein [unclassified Streptomyces]APU38539.1 hypothetical protein BSL84_00850 [Streptomyces sp. TN58]APU43927.1 hypothetical protein BSL84_33650 [Streptomyces sp. TN58]KJK42273.1 hypothetical protein UK14_32050 [Streptomyces sp. NRRL F-4428]
MPGSRVPGRTWTVRLTGHADHSASVSCSTEACRMPPRSKDTAALKRFAAEHVRAHARLATVRPDTSCACRAAQCALHETRTHCTGSTLLVLVHNPAVGQVWTLAEICQSCAPLIPHTAILGRSQPQPQSQGRQGPPAVPAPATAPTAAPLPVAGGFSSPQAAPEAPAARRRPQRRTARPRRAS